MLPSEGEISHVSDTALMVAACRALETSRPDGFVRDPFAARLAGHRGLAIVRSLSISEPMCFGIGVRSRFMDELLADTVANHGIACVVSLGCGLDARPWRLEMPPDLRWIEVDLPAILDYKTDLMAGEAPRCCLEQMTADLNDAAQRRAIFHAIGTARALVITEGLLMYLGAPVVQALAAEIALENGICQWLTDINSPAFRSNLASVRNVQAEDHLDGLQILEVLRRNGWSTLRLRSYIRDVSFASERIGAIFQNRPAGAESPPPLPPGDPSGVHLLQKR